MGRVPRAALTALARLLTEPVMGFLALAALSVGLIPALFVVPAWLDHALDVAGWVIIGLFALEYLVHLALARDRARFVADPWRILDAAIIVAPFVSLLPFAPDFMRSSPALRVLRLARVLLSGARARHGLSAHADMGITETQPSGPPQVSALSAHDKAPRPMSWQELMRWSAAPDERWVHAGNLDAARIKEIAGVVGLSDVMIDAALRESSYPRLASSARWHAFSLSLPGWAGQPCSPILD